MRLHINKQTKECIPFIADIIRLFISPREKQAAHAAPPLNRTARTALCEAAENRSILRLLQLFFQLLLLIKAPVEPRARSQFFMCAILYRRAVIQDKDMV